MSEQRRSGGRLWRVGALWKPRAGSKSLGSGSVTIDGLKQRFVVLPNDRKQAGSSQLDFVLMTSDEPEVDEFAREHRATSGRAADDLPI
jgi:hypothetical protein